MNVWARFFNLLRRPRIDSPSPIFVRAAGELVTEERALAYAAVWSCVRIIAETIATLGWHVVREQPDGTRLREMNTRMDRLLNASANREMTAFSWRMTALAHALLTGNHYSEIERDAGGRAIGLWPIDPAAVRIDRDAEGGLRYVVTNSANTEYVITARNMVHIAGLGWDGVSGMSVVGMARQTIGMGLAMDKYGSSFYENGAHVGMALRHPGKLSEQARDNLSKSFKENYSGSAKAFKTLILEEGIEVDKLSMSMADAQFLESRKFQISEICRWFRVPPHKVADLDRATFSNIEHQSIEFVQDTILPWCRRIEQEIDYKLFGEWATTTRLNIDTLLRGDIVSRYTAYEKGRAGGWLSANDVRRMENMAPVENGDIYLQPMNFIEAGTKPPEPKPLEAKPVEGDEDGVEEEPTKEVPPSNLLPWRPRKDVA